MELIKSEVIKQNENYQLLVEQIEAIIIEANYIHRWVLVEGYWNIGKLIREEFTNRDLTKLLQDLAVDVGVSQRTLWYALQTYDKYPQLNNLPEGKNISWNKLITKYLPAPKENKIEIPLPEGLYEVIVIDPPWPYGTEYNKETRRVASPYPELSIKELESMNIPSADNCVLWLWSTHKFVWDAKHLMDLWGFEYKLMLIWNKVNMGMGSWLRMQCEFCLLGIKGNPEWNLTNERDIITESRSEHSTKPEGFYQMVEKICPGKRLNIFAREERDDWTAYGNEIR